ncbi:hypothetical protein DZE36_09485 [Xanthomonas campestris pv. campestris]|uniref:Uncharacterized protein n=1 Tax=Xanthomonas campestris pv. campestris (strain ATCC 33913 / DSM 3586 / NCPPB 528 / LMG 568 / P 25) TaxID=190485 RepID=Q8PDP8_XANCP|nr:hypothetical protein XCC0287 [Xanthomonas campestris pv. campestris str. ATCC 33913]AKS14714.1 hypothetical protein AEA00_01445 [Xanthomonas campestris pv. campestris]AKS18734.1 hypothetical protein AEA01_01435 [Xanthomonas campestris pv. campestris]ALE67262.1 hypothetical protein AAW18_01415 [Xanthomonas campestris pv. campestris]QCX66080.1 hypothetical protein DFG55_06070 [Xanthomonas campestris pv. campestris]
MAVTVTRATPLPNRRICCGWSDVTTLPHASAVVGARLRAMGCYRNSFVARKRAPTCCVPPSRMAVTITHTTPLPNRRICCGWSDVTTLPHASAVLGARLRAIGRYRDSFIARERAPTWCAPPSRMAVTITHTTHLCQTGESVVAGLMSRHSHTRRRS